MIFDDINIGIFIQHRLQEIIPKIVKNNNRWNFKCPICGDSKKSKRKMRGNFYVQTNSYYCFNEGCVSHGLNIVADFDDQDLSVVKREFIEYTKDLNNLSPTRNKVIVPKREIKKVVLPKEWTPLQTHRTLHRTGNFIWIPKRIV